MYSHLDSYASPKAIALNDLLNLERVGECDLRIVYSQNRRMQANTEADRQTNDHNKSHVSLLDKNQLLVSAKNLLEQSQFAWLKQSVLAYESLLIMFDDSCDDYYSIVNHLLDLFRTHSVLFSLPSSAEKLVPDEGKWPTSDKPISTHVIPVCYHLDDEKYPHDRDKVCQYTGLTETSIIEAHVAGNYRVFAVGFMPNFAYLGELDKQIQIPRLAEPRRKVPAGAVAIADAQTAIYPSVSPGGWHIIGYTPLNVSQLGNIRFQAGEQVKFEAISANQFKQIHEAKKQGEHA